MSIAIAFTAALLASASALGSGLTNNAVPLLTANDLITTQTGLVENGQWVAATDSSAMWIREDWQGEPSTSSSGYLLKGPGVATYSPGPAPFLGYIRNTSYDFAKQPFRAVDERELRELALGTQPRLTLPRALLVGQLLQIEIDGFEGSLNSRAALPIGMAGFELRNPRLMVEIVGQDSSTLPMVATKSGLATLTVLFDGYSRYELPFTSVVNRTPWRHAATIRLVIPERIEVLEAQPVRRS